MWRNGECKERGDSVQKRENVTIRESKNLTYSSYVQLICTVPNIQLFQLGPVHYTVHNHISQAFPPFSICQLISICQILLIKERMWRKGGV